MGVIFNQSARSTVGIEWELQLVDKDSNDLRQAATSILDGATIEGHLHPLVRREMMLNTVEVTSHPRQTVAQCGKDLLDAVRFLRPITDKLRIDLASAGSHPFANPAYQRVTNNERYAELVERTRYWGHQMLLFGTHVHVGIESRAKVLPILRALLTRAGHLQSLAASSPFWSREDTGYASNRAMVFQQLPTAGVPRQFQHWYELEHYYAGMLKTGVIDSFDEIRWDIRPSPKLGTLEVRICDASTNIREVLAIAALIHCLVEDFSRRLDAGQALPVLPDWFVDENKWRSARYGMDAILIISEDGTEELCRDTVGSMMKDLAGVAHDLGCAEELSWLQDILGLGASYERQRIIAGRFNGSLDAVVELMRAEMHADRPLDPRAFEPTVRGERTVGRIWA
ncbi:MAG: glutamate--cysteine ligase [Actinomycetaceae bacterium]|nr:glutamate--cysteine ligase [Actinomycetaceae bacterium]